MVLKTPGLAPDRAFSTALRVVCLLRGAEEELPVTPRFLLGPAEEETACKAAEEADRVRGQLIDPHPIGPLHGSARACHS